MNPFLLCLRTLLFALIVPCGAQDEEEDMGEPAPEVHASSVPARALPAPAQERALSPASTPPARPSAAPAAPRGAAAPAAQRSRSVQAPASAGQRRKSGGYDPMKDPNVGYLSKQVLQNAWAVGGQINASGGFKADGNSDAWGFIRRVWDRQLSAMRKPALPVNDYPSKSWTAIASWDVLRHGDILATAQGHSTAPRWRAALYMGRGSVYESAPGRGAQVRSPNGLGLRYYYAPTHLMLVEDNGGAGGENAKAVVENPANRKKPLPCFLQPKDLVWVRVVNGYTLVRYKASDYTMTGNLVEATYEDFCPMDQTLVKQWIRFR